MMNVLQIALFFYFVLFRFVLIRSTRSDSLIVQFTATKSSSSIESQLRSFFKRGWNRSSSEWERVMVSQILISSLCLRFAILPIRTEIERLISFIRPRWLFAIAFFTFVMVATGKSVPDSERLEIKADIESDAKLNRWNGSNLHRPMREWKENLKKTKVWGLQ